MSRTEANQESPDRPNDDGADATDDSKPKLSETNIEIQTSEGTHVISEDSPVRIGNFGAIGKYHTSYCRYVADTDVEDIKPLSEDEREYHTNIEECSTCKKNRNDGTSKPTGGGRSWYNKATDPDYN